MTLYLSSFCSASSGLECSGLAGVSVILDFLLLNLFSFFVFPSLLTKGICGVCQSPGGYGFKALYSPLSCRVKVQDRNDCLCCMLCSPAKTLSDILWQEGSGATDNGIQSEKGGHENIQALTSVMESGGTR